MLAFRRFQNLIFASGDRLCAGEGADGSRDLCHSSHKLCRARCVWVVAGVRFSRTYLLRFSYLCSFRPLEIIVTNVGTCDNCTKIPC